jgi:hypothetical protein
MAILQDIERLGLQLEEADLDEIRAITEAINKRSEDDLVKGSLLEMHVSEYLSVVRPDIMSALTQDKEREMAEWRRKTERKYDEQGNRVCDELLCADTTGVDQCTYCGKYVCNGHNYGQNDRCCYECSKERGGNA